MPITPKPRLTMAQRDCDDDDDHTRATAMQNATTARNPCSSASRERLTVGGDR
jgi:hypothetical protein